MSTTSQSAIETRSLLRFTNGRYEDIDAQAARLQGYGQRYEQLSRGSFRGWFASYEFGHRFGIHLENTNQVLAQSGVTPSAHIALCFVAENSSPCFIDGMPIAGDDIAFWPSEYGFEARTTERMTVCVLDIAADPGGPLALLPQRIGKISGADRAAGLRRFALSGLEEFNAWPAAASSPASIASFTSSFVDSVTELIASESEQAVRPPSIGASRELRLFRRIRDRIHQNLDEGIDTASLCEDAGISRRALENIFGRFAGLGPAKYIRTVQLNQIRRELMSDDRRESIGDIAARWGVWHWSRFSNEYRQLFGELPSATRGRSDAREAPR